jgi:hypothetical protein
VRKTSKMHISLNLFHLIYPPHVSTSNCPSFHWGDPDLDGRIILRGIFRKWEGVVGTGWNGLRIGTVGGHL